jgi:hypothetical protein
MDEAGGGESERFELAEHALTENRSQGDQHTPARIMRDTGPDEESAESVYGEADDEDHADCPRAGDLAWRHAQVA